MRLGLAVSVILGFLLSGSVVAVDTSKARYLDSFPWYDPAYWFGGVSALEMAPDGNSMTLLSDRGMYFTADLVRTADGIAGAKITYFARIRSRKNKILVGMASDSEGLAIASDGTTHVAFEGVHRVARFNRGNNTTSVLLHPDAFKQMASNGSFEALAVDTQGRLYTMPENGLTAEGHIPVYRWNGRRWSQPFTLPKSEDFLPVGADFGPDGRFYLLERDTGFLGFRTQLRRWDLSSDTPKDGTVLIRTSSGTHDNLEGVSIWRDANGQLRATMVSDDNFLLVQQTELVEYALPD